MFDFHEKRKIRSLVFSKISIVLIVVVTILLSMSVFERFIVEREMAEKRSEKEKELEALKERAATLEEQVKHLQNERGIEEELRNRFDVVKEGEQVVIILEDEESGLPESAEPYTVSSEAYPERRSFFDFLIFWD